MPAERSKPEILTDINKAMIELVGVPLGVGLAPNYPLRKQYIEILKILGKEATSVNMEKARNMISDFRILSIK